MAKRVKKDVEIPLVEPGSDNAVGMLTLAVRG